MDIVMKGMCNQTGAEKLMLNGVCSVTFFHNKQCSLWMGTRCSAHHINPHIASSQNRAGKYECDNKTAANDREKAGRSSSRNFLLWLFAHASTSPIISDAFVPPKPNELDRATLTSRSTFAFGAKSIGVSTAGLSKFRVGGAT